MTMTAWAKLPVSTGVLTKWDSRHFRQDFSAYATPAQESTRKTS
jgi:hypothetical protein